MTTTTIVVVLQNTSGEIKEEEGVVNNPIVKPSS